VEEPIRSVWARTAHARRERPVLSREHVVSEAVRLLDSEGIDALSMRRLGSRLGAGATSLYTYVNSKDDLIELVVDEVYGELELPGAQDLANWRQAITRTARSWRLLILRHPWIVSVLGDVGLAYLGPNMMRVSDRILALLEAAGFAPDEASHAMKAVAAYVIGVGISEAAWLTKLAGTRQTEREWVERLWPAAEQAAREYPTLRERYATRRGRDPGQMREEAFGYGLERILDGLAARLSDGLPRTRPTGQVAVGPSGECAHANARPVRNDSAGHRPRSGLWRISYRGKWRLATSASWAAPLAVGEGDTAAAHS
jgi:AcrR family transcriptional regulator